jgi:mitochondrial fission process protein 1
VAQTKKVFVNMKNPRVKAWGELVLFYCFIRIYPIGPTLTGLAVVPVLPYLFDRPIEHITDEAFDWIKGRIIDQQKTGAGKNDL